jgi:hypothetical protein
VGHAAAVPCAVIFENRGHVSRAIRIRDGAIRNEQVIDIEKNDYLAKLRQVKDLSYNNPTFAISRMSRDDSNCSLQLHLTDYLSTIGTHDAIEHELLLAASNVAPDGEIHAEELPLRLAFFDKSEEEKRRHAGLAISTVIATRTMDGDYLMHVRRRSQKTAVHSGLLHVLPAGMFQADIAPELERDIEFAVVREYGEELFGNEFDSNRDNPHYIRHEWKEVSSIDRLIENGDADLIHTGILLNRLNLRPEICCVLMIHQPGWFELQPVAVNWEYVKRKDIERAKVDDTRPPLTTFSLTRFEQQFFESTGGETPAELVANWVPPGLGALVLAARVGRKFMKGPGLATFYN